MQVSVVTTSMRRRHWMSSRSFATSPGSCPRLSQWAKSTQRALVVAGTAQRAAAFTSFLRNSRPASPITSMSPIRWTLVTGTRRCAPQKRPTSIWYCRARFAAAPRGPAGIPRSSALSSKAVPFLLLPLAGLGVEVLLELVGDFLPGVGVGRRRPFSGDVRPFHREIRVQLEPLLGLRLGVGQDRLGRVLRLAHAAVDALVGMDDEHVVALVEAVDGADLDAVHVLALDAVLGPDVSHRARIIRLAASVAASVAASGRRTAATRG